MKHSTSCGCAGSKIGWILVIVGALNWGLVGLGHFFGSNWNVVNLLLGSVSWLEAVVYLLVGLSGLLLLFGCRCKKCTAGGHGAETGGMSDTHGEHHTPQA